MEKYAGDQIDGPVIERNESPIIIEERVLELDLEVDEHIH